MNLGLILLMYGNRCLQEITYLTSTQALNPLPSRPLLSNSSLPVTVPNMPAFDQPNNNRPRKIVPENANLGISGQPPPGTKYTTEQIPSINGVNPSNIGSTNPPPPPHASILSERSSLPQQSQQQIHEHGPQSIQLMPQLEERSVDHLSNELHRSSDAEPITAIFRPDDSWREQVRQASQGRLKAGETDFTEIHQFAETAGHPTSWDGSSRDDEEEMKEDDDDVDEINITDEAEGGKVWKARKALRK